MNNEIKEILDRLKYIVFNEIIDYGEELSLNECKLLLNYITNLQQENERLKEWKEDLLKENIELENIRKEAIEYIKSYNLPKDLGHLGEAPISIRELRDLLNILQNGSEENEN